MKEKSGGRNDWKSIIASGHNSRYASEVESLVERSNLVHERRFIVIEITSVEDRLEGLKLRLNVKDIIRLVTF